MWYSDEILANYGSDNGLLPDGTMPLPKAMLTQIIGIHLSAISQKMYKICWQKLPFEMKFLKVLMYLPGNTELTWQGTSYNFAKQFLTKAFGSGLKLKINIFIRL